MILPCVTMLSFTSASVGFVAYLNIVRFKYEVTDLWGDKMYCDSSDNRYWCTHIKLTVSPWSDHNTSLCHEGTQLALYDHRCVLKTNLTKY